MMATKGFTAVLLFIQQIFIEGLLVRRCHFEQRLEGGQGVSHTHIPGGEGSLCKTQSLVCFWKSKKAGWAWVEWSRAGGGDSHGRTS